MQPTFSILAQDYVPRDVQRFIDLRAACDMSNEPHRPCGGTEKELIWLKQKYAANSTIMQILNQFDVSDEIAEIVQTPTPAAVPKKGKGKRAG